MSDNAILAALTILQAGQDRVLAGQDKLQAGQDKLQAGQDKLEAGQDELEGRIDRLEASLTTLRVDAMARMDRLQNLLTGLRDDMIVTQGSADRAVEVNDNTRAELRRVDEVISIMLKKIRKLEQHVFDPPEQP